MTSPGAAPRHRWLASLLLAGLQAGCTQPASQPLQAAAAQCPHLPAPPLQPAPRPPVSGFRQALVPGHWDWDGHDYAWAPARWVTLFPRTAPVWTGAHWSAERGACVWHAARFTTRPGS